MTSTSGSDRSEKDFEVHGDLSSDEGPSRRFDKDFEWGDIESSEEEIEDFDLEEEKEVVNFQDCCPRIDECAGIEERYKQILSVLQDNYSTRIKNFNLKTDCTFNLLKNVFHNIFKIATEEDCTDTMKINILDSFLKFRHDFLALKLAKILSLDFEKTDKSFKEVFGIDSARTPDFIYKVNEFYNIIEVSAVTDIERGALSKGDLDYGYKSKYQKEIDQLTEMGHSIRYYVVLFDVKDEKNDDFKEKLKLIVNESNFETDINVEMNDLDFYRKEFCSSTKGIGEIYGEFYSNLFEEKFEINKFNQENTLKFIFGEPVSPYTGSYKRISITTGIYENVRRNGLRLEEKLFRLMKSEENPGKKYSLFFDMNRGNFAFKEPKGYRELKSSKVLSDWLDLVDRRRIDLICENLLVILSGQIIDSPKADIEYFNYEKFQGLEKLKIEYKDSEVPHRGSFFPRPILVKIKDFSETLTDKTFKDKMSIFEDEGYEEKILTALKNNSTMEDFQDPETGENFTQDRFFNKRPFALCELNDSMLDLSIEKFQIEYRRLNDEDKNLVLHVKQPFLMPLYKISLDSYTSIKSKPKILSYLSEFKSIGPYTDKIISIINSEGFEFGTKKDIHELSHLSRKDLAELQREINSKLKEKFKESDRKCHFKLKDLEGSEDYRKRLSELNKKIRQEQSKNKSSLCVVRLSRKNANFKKDFQSEMDHFKKRKTGKILKGVSTEPDFQMVERSFLLLKEQLSSPSGVKFEDDFIEETVGEDIPLLKNLKTASLEKVKKFNDWIRGSNFYHSCEFASRLCHSLLFHSQTSVNSDYVSVDNLGYNDVLLLVKGGKKIFPTKKSKLFRLIMPTYESASDLYKVSNLPSSFDFFENDNKVFMITPWMNFHETILCDGLTTLHRNIGFLCLNSEYYLEPIDNFNNCYMNLLLFFHNRRQTETFLHNMRYIIMNCLSDFTSIDEILPELAGFNSDCIQYYIRECIIRKFKGFSKKLKDYHDKNKSIKIKDSLIKGELLNMFTNYPITDLNQLATSVYVTYMMSKAPTNQTLEQVSNLKSMMVTHEEFLSLNTDFNDGKMYKTIDQKEINYDFKKYYNSLMENDFNLDPKYCVLLGKFMGDYLVKTVGEGEIHRKWSKVLGKSWDEFSNTKGLRGDEDDFFGSKGYQVVYKKILDENPNLINDINKILEINDNDKDFAKKMKSLNQTYRDRIKKEDLEEIILHVVDKKQRGGRREIFVMDRKTKLYQQLIENFIGEICKFLPNEVISVPSNKRLSTIHTKVFEGGKSDKMDYYMVMDCRKWAPKSVVQKFILFLSGMRKSLPATFLKHCYNFFDLLCGKKIYTRKHIFDLFKNNENLKIYCKNFVYDEKRSGYYFKMPYSWAMGIFNYFSSFMHVANQMHISHLSRIHFSRNFDEEISMNMIAHSDDSAGKIIANDKKSVKTALFIYETMMKASNHLISKKKSNCGRAYYEFISILYIDGTLLSLVVKFAGLFNFHPTDKGYSTDINEAYSKCIELILNGSTLSQAYVGLKIQSSLIRRFYFNRKSEKTMYNIPPKMMGIPDAHPLMVLLCGSEADLLRLNCSLSEEKMKTIYFLNNEMCTGDSQIDGFLKSFDCTPNVRLRKDLKLLLEKNEIENLENDWTIKNVNFPNTSLNAVQFLIKLKEKGFVAALQDESLTRRISRAYFYRSNPCLETKYGLIKYEDFVEIVSLFFAKNDNLSMNSKNKIVLEDLEEVFKKEYSDFDLEKYKKLFDCLFSEPMKLCQYMKNIHYREENLTHSLKTTKPLHIKILNTTEKLPFKIQTQALASWIKYPEKRWILPDTRNMHTVEKFFIDHLNDFDLKISDLSVEEINGLLMRMEKKNETEYFCYSNVPSHMREISTYQDVLNFLAHNTFRGKYIEGLTVKFGKMMSVLTQNVVSCLTGDDLDWTLSFITMILVLSKHKDFVHFCKLKFKRPPFLENKEENSSLTKIFLEMENYWRKNIDVYRYIKLEIEKAKSKCFETRFDSKILNDCIFHSFVKTQYLLKNSWMGVGQMYVNLVDIKLSFSIRTNKVLGVVSNIGKHHFLNHEIDYINLCFKNAQMGFLSENFRFIDPDESRELFLGIDESNFYKIAQGSELIKGLPLVIDYNVKTFLSKPETGKIFFTDKGKIRWFKTKDEIEFNYKIETIPIEMQNSLKLLNNLIPESEHNKRIINSMSPLLRKEIYDYMIKTLSVELKIGKEELISNHKASKMFKILKFCMKNQVCETTPKMVRKKDFPAQEGGLLNVLIGFAEKEKNFDFDWEKVMSPAYLKMKSTQPEAFMASLVKNVEKSYNEMYDDEDKNIIMRNIISISKIEDENYEEKLLETLCNWSYSGVLGTLTKLEREIKSDNFRTIRNYNSDFPFIGFFENMIFTFYEVLLKCSENYLTKIGEINCDLENWEDCFINRNNIKRIFSGLIHSENVSRFGGKNCPVIEFEKRDIYVYTMLKRFSEIEEIRILFQNFLNENGVLRVLPFNPDFVDEWFISYNTMRNLYRKKKIVRYLDVTQKIDREEKENPYLMTKSILSDMGIKLKPTSLHHFGLIEDGFLSHFREKKFGKMKDQVVRVNFKLKDPEEVRNFHFNENFFPKYPFTEDFLDSETYEEIEMELLSSETDVDYIKENLNDFEDELYLETTSKKVYAVKDNQRLKVLSIDATVILNLVKTKSPIKNKIRQAGETVVLVTDSLLSLRPEFYTKTGSLVLNFRDDYWGERKSLYSKTDLFAIVFTKYLNIGLWENVLHAKFIDQESLRCLQKIPVGVERNNLGLLVDNSGISSKTALEMNEELRKNLEEEEKIINKSKEEKEVEEKIELIKNKVKSFEKQGYDYNFIKKYLLEIEEKRDNWESLFSQLNDILSSLEANSKIVEKLNSSIEKLVKSNKDPKIYEYIFQIPRMLGISGSRLTSQRNISLKEQDLIAEIESIFPGFMSKILSDTLTITEKMRMRYERRIRGLKKQIRSLNKNKEGKTFALNLITLIVNDAATDIRSNRSEEDEIWMDALDWLDKKFDEEDESSEDDGDVSSNMGFDESSEADLKYKTKIFDF